jgi:hypothetical protein
LRRKHLVALISAAVIIIVALAAVYQYVLPRTDVKVITVFHEGSLNVINVNVKVRNDGNGDITDISVTVTVKNATQVFLQKTFNRSNLAPSSEVEFKPYFYGDQYEIYHITVTISFTSHDVDFAREFSYTAKDYMTLKFEESIQKVHL